MIRTLFIFMILLGSVMLGIQLNHDPGYILITLNQWSIETSLWLGFMMLIVMFLILHLALNSFFWLTHVPSEFRLWRTKKRSIHAQKKTRQGLIEFSEGHWKSAKAHLVEGLKDTETPLINYLTAARAAQELGDLKLRDDYLREAQQSMPEAKIAVELTQAQLQLGHKQWEQALATLRHLQDLSPNHTYVLKLLVCLYEEINDWEQLILLIPKLKQHDVMTPNEINQLEHRAYWHTLLLLIRQNQQESVNALIEKLPKSLKYDPRIIAKYSEYLIACHEDERAEHLLRKTLNKQFHKQLIHAYGQLNPHHARLEFVQSLLKQEPDSAALHLCLGHLNKNNQLWGQAKTHFESSIALEQTAEAYTALGDLLLQLNDNTAAMEIYRKGLLSQANKITP